MLILSSKTKSLASGQRPGYFVGRMPAAPGAPAARIMFSVAEVSADLHAADLALELRRLRPSIALFGVGGERMAAAGVDVHMDITDESTFGLWDILGTLPRHLRNLSAIRRMLRSERPDLVVLVDAPGLNFTVARVARRLGIRSVYYVPPQTWLWNPGPAARRLSRSVDLVVATFEREAALYERAGARVAYYGHPLAGLAAGCHASKQAVRRRLGIPEDTNVVGLFPGSRKREIASLLPAMLEAARLSAAQIHPLHVVAAAASARLRPFIERRLGGQGNQVQLLDRARDALAASDVVLAASGTVLLEAVALDVPAVMTYRLDGLTRFYADRILKVRRALSFYSIPNITAGE
ncbi:MAG: lipid-A-disaccharide synthase, partial [Acidobacteria bacterium]